MAGIVQTAVNNHSKVSDIKLLRFLLYLADGANINGEIDPAPTYETMATWAGVSTRTIQTWLNKLTECRELEQTRVGSGPGRPSAYRILLPLDVKVEKVEEKQAKVEDIKGSDFYLEFLELKQKVEEIAVFLSTFANQKVEEKQAKVEELPPLGRSATRENEQLIHIDPLLILGGVATATDNGAEYDHAQRVADEEIEIMAGALSGISKQTMAAGVNDKSFREAAVALVKDGVTVEDVAYFGKWWERWPRRYPGKPALKTILDNIKTALDLGEQAYTQFNGKREPANMLEGV